MKYILILFIKMYWLAIPPFKRRRCIFRESCSKKVFADTSKFGFVAGVKTLLFRIKNCNNQFIITVDPDSEKKVMYLKTGVIISENEISENVLKSIFQD